MKIKKIVCFLLLAVSLNLFTMPVENNAADETEPIDKNEYIIFYEHPETDEIIGFTRDGWDHMASTDKKGTYYTNDTDIVPIKPGSAEMVYYRTSRERGYIYFYKKDYAGESAESACVGDPDAKQLTKKPPKTTDPNKFTEGTRSPGKRLDGEY